MCSKGPLKATLTNMYWIFIICIVIVIKYRFLLFLAATTFKLASDRQFFCLPWWCHSNPNNQVSSSAFRRHIPSLNLLLTFQCVAETWLWISQSRGEEDGTMQLSASRDTKTRWVFKNTTKPVKTLCLQSMFLFGDLETSGAANSLHHFHKGRIQKLCLRQNWREDSISKKQNKKT